MTPTSRRVAVVTGASKGLGQAVADGLVDLGWHVVVDGRDAGRLFEAAGRWGPAATVLPGDVTDGGHRGALAEAARSAGGAALLVNNASELGPSPQPRLADYPLDVLRRVYEVDVLAPLALVQALLPQLSGVGGVLIDVSSDAASAAYEGWGGYGSAKAALDQLTAVLAVEHPELAVYAFDPGDMATDMQQRAFPGEDISDRPMPASVVPAVLALAQRRVPSGRYRAADLLAGVRA